MISSLFAIFQYLGLESIHNLRLVFEYPKGAELGFFTETPPSISYTSIQLSTILIISILFILILKKIIKFKIFEWS